MPRLKFAFLLSLVLASPAAADTAARPAADPKAAAAQLFGDPLERETFIAMMSSTPALAAAVTEAQASALQAGGSDANAVADSLKKNPSAAAWNKGVVDALKETRTVLAAGLKLSTPQTDYPKTPLVGELIKKLHKQNAADLFVSLNVPKYDGPAAPAAVSPPAPCPKGTSRALNQVKSAAASGDAGAFTGEDCKPAPVPPNPSQAPQTPPDPSKIPTPPSATPPAVTDQRTTTGAPPSPGKDDGGNKGGGKGFFDGLPWDQIKGGAGIGAAIGMIMAFGTPLGIVGGALLGAAVGGLLFSGAIGKLFGGGKKDS